MTTAREWLLQVQKEARKFSFTPIEQHFPNLSVLDIQSVPGSDGEHVQVSSGVVFLRNISGRSLWLKSPDLITGDLQGQFLQPLYTSKLKQLDDLLKSNVRNTLVIRIPGEDTLLTKLRNEKKFKFSEVFTVALYMGFPVRVTVAAASYISGGAHGHMLFSNILVGVC